MSEGIIIVQSYWRKKQIKRNIQGLNYLISQCTD